MEVKCHPSLESAISPKSSGSFHWRMKLETKIWVLQVLIVTGVLLLLNPLSKRTELGTTWVYTNLCTLIYLKLFLYSACIYSELNMSPH